MSTPFLLRIIAVFILYHVAPVLRYKNYCHNFYSIFGKMNFDREMLLKAIQCPYNLVGSVQVK